MVRRRPHKVMIETAAGSFEQDERGDIIPGDKLLELQGRFEPAPSNERLSYKAKFYTPLNQIKPFELDGSVLVYEGRRFQIIQLFNYQTHCELWLV